MLDFLGVAQGCERLYEELVGAHYALHGKGVHGELAEVVAEGLPVEFSGEVGWCKIVEPFLRLAVQKERLHLVMAGGETAVERDAVEPVAQVALFDAAAQHALEVDDEVEGGGVKVVGIHQHDGGRP